MPVRAVLALLLVLSAFGSLTAAARAEGCTGEHCSSGQGQGGGHCDHRRKDPPTS